MDKTPAPQATELAQSKSSATTAHGSPAQHVAPPLGASKRAAIKTLDASATAAATA